LAAAGFRSIAEGTIAEGAYADRVRQVWGIVGAALDRDRMPGDVDVAAAHLHVAGATLARSEKQIHVGDDTATDAAALPPVSYAAFGHIHKPQRIPGSMTGRYAGSMIPIDFGEEGEEKGAVVVEAHPGRAARVEFVPLSSGRPLVTVACALGELEQVLSPHRDAIVRVRVTDIERIEHLAERVREYLPSGAVLYQVTQPSLRQTSQMPRHAADTDVVTLLRGFAAARGVTEADAEALVALWQAASDGDDTDLSGGATMALDGALGTARPAQGQDTRVRTARPARGEPKAS
jgi:exonuclease SbcD